MHTGLRYGFAAAAGVLLTAAVACAQATGISLGAGANDSSQPIEITSEELRIDQVKGTATFTGNVIIGQGQMRMTAAEVLVEYAENPETGETDISVVRAFGGVTVVGPEEAAESDTLVYTPDDANVVMTGDVLVTQGPSALSSDRLVYNLDTGEGRMEGRVKTVLQAGGN